MTLIAGLDFGTSSVKLLLVTHDGDVVARAQAAYPTHHGSAGEVEQDPADWWNAACTVLAETSRAFDIDAIGLTGQMQDLILVDGINPVGRAILYSDTRAPAQNERLRVEFTEWEQQTGNHQDLSNVPSKIAWLADNDAAALQSARHLLFSAPAFVAWRAGAAAACDVTTASTTGLLDVDGRDWMHSLAEVAGARADQLPLLVGQKPGDTVIGTVAAGAAIELGVRAGIPLVLAMGDAGSTTDGLVGSEPGDAYLYLGTTGWLAAVTEAGDSTPSPIHSLVLPGWQTRLRIGAVQSAGSAAAWAKNAFLPELTFAEIESAIASRVGELSARPLCLPGITGERTPVRDGEFRGAFVGVHEATDPIDFYLAVLTGVAYGLRHAADAMGIQQQRLPLVGGAADSAAWRQILADVFDATIVTKATADPGTHSAARAAAAALGIDAALSPLFARSTDEIETVPSPAQPEYERRRAIHRALYDALAPSFHQLAT